MSAPKNSSLGRGLGDLLGGVPETIGVARHPSAPSVRETVPAAAPDPVVPVPVEPPAQTQAAPEHVVAPVASSWATPRHLVVMGTCLLVVLLGGVALGVFIGRPRPVPVAVVPPPVAVEPRVVVVTNTVRIAPAPAAPRPVVDASEFKELEAEGLATEVGPDGTVRLVFASPLFSSRLVRDPEQYELLVKVGGILARHAGQWDVQVTGYTDATPLKNGGPFRDNQELGLARAVEVMRHFWRQAHIPMAMMQASSAGGENPLFPGDDEATRRLNRTVTISIRPAPALPPGE